jgi:trehalose 6-phosphate phosphatase
MQMKHLFSPTGEAALAEAMQRKPLLAFDFDGTLVPIVARPDDARMSQAIAARLTRLGAHLPVAIVTGRSIADVQQRLGFVPHYIVGSHGAENSDDPQSTASYRLVMDGLRRQLARRQGGLADAGVQVEDKGQSIALHYRLSRERRKAISLIEDLLSDADLTLRTFPGKMVVNVVPADAPDKAAAVRALVARCGAANAVFAGDDVNDEPVFVAAPPSWLTIRVGRDDPTSSARFFLDSASEVAMLLDRMLAGLPARGSG